MLRKALAKRPADRFANVTACAKAFEAAAAAPPSTANGAVRPSCSPTSNRASAGVSSTWLAPSSARARPLQSSCRPPHPRPQERAPAPAHRLHDPLRAHAQRRPGGLGRHPPPAPPPPALAPGHHLPRRRRRLAHEHRQPGRWPLDTWMPYLSPAPQAAPPTSSPAEAENARTPGRQDSPNCRGVFSYLNAMSFLLREGPLNYFPDVSDSAFSRTCTRSADALASWRFNRPFRAAPRTEPGERISRTGLPPWVNGERRSDRGPGMDGCAERGSGKRRSNARRFALVQRARWLRAEALDAKRTGRARGTAPARGSCVGHAVVPVVPVADTLRASACCSVTASCRRRRISFRERAQLRLAASSVRYGACSWNLPFAVFAADVREAEEVERLGPLQPVASRSPAGRIARTRITRVFSGCSSRPNLRGARPVPRASLVRPARTGSPSRDRRRSARCTPRRARASSSTAGPTDRARSAGRCSPAAG